MPIPRTVLTEDTDNGEVRFKHDGTVYVPHPRHDDRYVELSEEVVAAINNYSDPTEVIAESRSVAAACPYCAWERTVDRDELPLRTECPRCHEPLLIKEEE